MCLGFENNLREQQMSTKNGISLPKRQQVGVMSRQWIVS